MAEDAKIDLGFLDKPTQVINKGKTWVKSPAKLTKPDSCIGCSLYDLSSGFTRPEGKGTIPLLIIGEAAGEAEAKDGLPLRPYAPSGSVVEKAIKQLGYTREQFVLWNVVGCRPPGNLLEGEWYERGAIDHCRRHFDKVVEQFRPKAIIALGNVALMALTGSSGKDRTVSSLRGYVLWSDRYNLPVIPTYHPSFVRRGGLKLFWVLRHDLNKAIAIAQGKFKEGEGYVLCQTPSDIREKTQLKYVVQPPAAYLQDWLTQLRTNPETFFSYDIETGYTAEQDEEEREVKGKEITQIQFSQAVGEGIALKWNAETEEFAREVFALANPRGNQNTWRFDTRILRLNDVEPAPVGVTSHDTMIMWHCYQPDLPQKLQFAASFFGMPFPWKHFVSQDFGLYGVCDVDAVQRMYARLPEVMKKKVNSETGMSVWDGYLQSFVPLQSILEGMQRRGIGVDVEGQAKLREWVLADQARVNEELQPLVPMEIKKRKEWKMWPDDVKPIVEAAKTALVRMKTEELVAEGLKVTKKATTIILKIKDIAAADELGLGLSYGIAKLGYKRDGSVLYKQLDYNPNSTFQLRALLKHFKVDIPTTLDGVETTGKGELRKLLKKSKAGEVIPIVMKTLEYRELGKAVNTYIDGKGWTPDSEGRVHTTFTHKSATWQLTSIEPNIQNIPKHTRLGGEIRKLIVPRPGHVLLEADYSSFHVLTLGFNAESERYMQLARSDAHSFVTAHMLKTRIKEGTQDELERETKEHIKDLDTWLSLPRPDFLNKLGWIKKIYGKTLRQQAKAGILGVGLGLGVDKLHSHNEDSFNPSEVQAEQWLGDNPKVQFYSPISKSMKPASYFPHEMQVMLAQEKLGKQAAKELRGLLERLFPEVFRWQQKIRAQAHRDGYLVSRYGGIRWFHNVYEFDSKRGVDVPGEDAEAAIAFFVQNDAFGKIREAMLEIGQLGLDSKYNLCNSVHDSLVFDCPADLVDEAAKSIKFIMEKPATMLKHPILCPEGLACGVEVSAGLTWKDLKEMHI